MNEVYVIYWSGTGNTETMAQAVAQGIETAGAKATALPVSEASVSLIKDAKAFALGCPAMGSEELEEGEMEPFVSEVEAIASGKTVGLFGSYGWGGGEWMTTWASRMEGAGAKIAGGEGVIANNTPEEEALEACKKLGETLAAV